MVFARSNLKTSQYPGTTAVPQAKAQTTKTKAEGCCRITVFIRLPSSLGPFVFTEEKLPFSWVRKWVGEALPHHCCCGRVGWDLGFPSPLSRQRLTECLYFLNHCPTSQHGSGWIPRQTVQWKSSVKTGWVSEYGAE